jgi:hypothetical protein
LGKLVVLELRKGESEQYFEVILEIGMDGERHSIRVEGKLPPAPEVSTHYSSWRSAYRSLDLRRRLEIRPRKDPKETIENCYKSAQAFSNSLRAWYDFPQFASIREKLLQKLQESDEIRLIVQTKDSQLRRLPWHLFFERFLESYRKAEVALSLPEYELPEKSAQATKRERVRILAVLGNSTGINIEEDLRLLENLPDAETVFLAEPKRRELDEYLRDERGWDILFFAGHSSSQNDGETGRIYINKTESLSINQLKYAFVTAMERGLKLAIFNSCDGLGLARELAELHIPQVIVMREPVPDKVAQEFLKHFLQAFSGGKSLYMAVREARERLQGLEAEFPCADWLPVIYQHPAEVPPTWQQLHGVEQGLELDRDLRRSESLTDDFRSEREVDYTRLRYLLADEKWREADKETLSLMLKICGSEQEGRLATQHIENFPCQDLHTIDQLWRKYSNECFGFSLQRRIWESVGGTPDAGYRTLCYFGDRVGWRRGGRWLSYDERTFNHLSPEGHLPYLCFQINFQPWQLLVHEIAESSGFYYLEKMRDYGVNRLFSRAKKCNL